MMSPVVTILTYCAHPFLAYGTLLVFKTLRTGFPSARIEVYDNGSHPDVREQIRSASRAVDAVHHQGEGRHYTDHLRWLLLHRDWDSAPLVILDPDVIFWGGVETWNFDDTLIAGRLIPAMRRDALVALPRLHSSLLWVPDVHRLRREVARVERLSFGWDAGIAQRTTYVGGRGYFADTLAGLYNAMPDLCRPFSEDQLDAYDHLFFGSHFNVIGSAANVIGDPRFEVFKEGHRAAASGQLDALRGLWRAQQARFESWGRTEGLSADLLTPEALSASISDCSQEMQAWQGMEYSKQELMDAAKVVVQSIHGTGSCA